MARRFIFTLAASLLLSMLGPTCLAQLVVVRPGYIKAPFVRVYTNPDGSTHVRAPFVSSYSYPRRWQGLREPAVRGPRHRSISDLDWAELRRAVMHLAVELDQELSRLPTGAVWQSYFSLGKIAEVVRQDSALAPIPSEVAEITSIVETFDTATENPDLRVITRLRVFDTLHAAMRELVMPPDLRARKQLVASAEGLQFQLGQLSNGREWQEYFSLQDVLGTGSNGEPKASRSGEAELKHLQKMLERIELVSGRDEYHMIARLPELQITRLRIKTYLDQHVEPAADLEELPPPAPQDRDQR